MTRIYKPLNVYIVPELREAVTNLAKIDKRTLTKEVEFILEQYVIERLGDNYKIQFTVTPKEETHIQRYFSLRLGKEYYNKGFFNIPKNRDFYLITGEASVTLQLGNLGYIINARLSHKSNPNQSARIFGGKILQEWFSNNFNEGDDIRIEIISETLIKLDKGDVNEQ